jgi:hypothetical protein
VLDIIDSYAYPLRGLDFAAAARYVGLDPSAFLALVKDGRLLHPRRLGDAEVWDRLALDAAFDAIPAHEQPARKQRSAPLMSKEWPGHPNVYTPETLAERWSCSANHIRVLIRRGDLAGSMLGGRLLRIWAAVVATYENADTGKARAR